MIKEAVKLQRENETLQNQKIFIKQIVSFIFSLDNTSSSNSQMKIEISELKNIIFDDIFNDKATFTITEFGDVIIDYIKIELCSPDSLKRLNSLYNLLNLSKYIDQNSFLQKIHERNMIETIISDFFVAQYSDEFIS